VRDGFIAVTLFGFGWIGSCLSGYDDLCKDEYSGLALDRIDDHRDSDSSSKAAS